MEVNVETTDEAVNVSLGGKIDREFAARADELLETEDPSAQWRLDLSEVERVDALGTVGLLKLARHVREAGGEFSLEALSEAAEDGLKLYGFEDLLESSPPPEPPPEGLFEQAGQALYDIAEAFTGLMVLVYDTAYWLFLAPFRGKGFKHEILAKEITRNGTHAIPIISLVAFLFGLVMSINGAYLLSYWGQNQLIADMVGVGLTREIAPVLVGIMLAARSGAAISAEIGTMKVREEIDAMWTMGMNPAKFLIVPKVTALGLAAPALSLVANVVGMVGSFLASTLVFGVSGQTFLRRLQEAIYMRDIVAGLVKSLAFGIIVGFVGCWFGLSVEGSAEEVGDATTRSVVWGIVLVIVADGFFSTFFYYVLSG